MLLFGGRLTDRYGARRMFVLGLVLFGAASLGAALTPGYAALTILRAVQGVGGAMVAPAALGLVRGLHPDPAGFGRAMAVWGGVSVLGAVLGFITSGMVAEFVNWRWMFAVPIAVSLLGLAGCAGLLPATGRAVAGPEATRPGLDLPGALLATSGIALASFGLIASNDAGWGSILTVGPLAAGAVLLLAFVLAERRRRDPLLPPDFLCDPLRLAGLGGVLLAAAVSVLIEYALLVYLQQSRGWTPFETAASFLPFAVALIGTNSIAAAIVGRIGAERTMAAGFLTAALGLAALAFLEPGTDYLTVLLPAQILVAVGIALVFAGAAVLSMAHVPPWQMGLAGGVMNTAMELGPTVGFSLLMAVAATAADSVAGYARAFGTAAATYTLFALVALAIAGRRGRRPG